MQTIKPIIIIGSGLAGYTLARELRKLDDSVPLIIITADDGRYYSKPQLSSALTHNKSAAALGLMTAERMAIQLKAEVIANTKVTAVDGLKQQLVAGDKIIEYAKLVFACGAESIKLGVSQDLSQHLLTINNLSEYEHFREAIKNKKRIAIIGAGLVGCEFANDLLNAGYKLDIIALSAAPLDLLLPPAAALALQTAFEAAGINWHLQSAIHTIKPTADGYLLSLSNAQQIQVDVILSAIGIKPVIALAQLAGIKVRQGIIVDRYLQTSTANIYALGDCAEIAGQVMLYVQPLAIGAKALAQTLLGEPIQVNYPPMPIIIKTPVCPVVVQPPLLNAGGEWQITGAENNIRALFYDLNQQLKGFALTGSMVAEKLALLEKLPQLMF